MAEVAVFMQEAKALQDAIDSHTESIKVSQRGLRRCCSHLAQCLCWQLSISRLRQPVCMQKCAVPQCAGRDVSCVMYV
jgi:hypothetical protein